MKSGHSTYRWVPDWTDYFSRAEIAGLESWCAHVHNHVYLRGFGARSDGIFCQNLALLLQKSDGSDSG